jgi:DNA repair exonuclease SbcCD ATPase subunit
VKDGEEIDPMTASGGGVVHVASFALRIAMWSLQRPRPRETILLDEPFHFLSRDLQPKASELLKVISKRLGIQFVIVTHDDSLTEAADKVFEVKQ